MNESTELQKAIGYINKLADENLHRLNYNFELAIRKLNEIDRLFEKDKDNNTLFMIKMEFDRESRKLDLQISEHFKKMKLINEVISKHKKREMRKMKDNSLDMNMWVLEHDSKTFKTYRHKNDKDLQMNIEEIGPIKTVRIYKKQKLILELTNSLDKE